MTLHRVTLTLADADKEFDQVVSKLLRHDHDSGVNLWAGSPDPVMLLWSPRIYEFLLVLERLMSYLPARGIVREVGFRSGFDGSVETSRALGLRDDGVATLLAMPRILAGAGWGVSELEYDDSSTGRVRWTFPKGTAVGIAAARQGRRTVPACAFYEGFGAGWVKGSIGLGVEFLERECLGEGDDVCLLESRPLG